MAAAGVVEYRVLGPLEALVADAPVQLGGRTQRALLAALLMHANEPVSPSRLIDFVWGQTPPATAERQSVAVALGLAAVYDRPIHIVHVSRREEIELIAEAKGRGLPVTCEVTPHHLFLSAADAPRLGPLGDMRPVLGSAGDVAALWAHLNDTIDCIATDHAPHTLAEKHSAEPPPGVPGLETSLPLMLSAVVDGRLTPERLVALMHDNPRRIYGLPAQPDTRVEVDLTPWTIPAAGWQTKCDWTPFAGLTAGGRVRRVVLRGQTVYEGGVVLAAPGSGMVIV